MSDKVVAIVPLKLNNQRLPGKNLKKFDNGVPLLQYILKSLIDSNSVSDIYIYCSDEKIISYIPKEVTFLKRPSCLDQDTTKINDVLKMFAESVYADIYLLAHATAPFISAKTIDKVVSAVKSGEHDSSFTVEKKQEFIWQLEQPNYELDKIPRTQDLTPIYVETSGLYAYKRDIILENNRRIGFTPFLVEVSKVEAIDIDEEVDFHIANALSNMQSNKFF